MMEGHVDTAMAVVRPPGHHAECQRAMGFCFFNNVAVTACVARALGAARVLILDWDVHHGNGIQHIHEADDTIMYISLHRWAVHMVCRTVRGRECITYGQRRMSDDEDATMAYVKSCNERLC